MKSLLIAICVLLFALPAQADTMTEMHDCIQDCLGSYSDLSWDFYLCVRDCLKKWDAQKGDINVAVAPSSSGYGRLLGLPFLRIAAGDMVTVDFDIASADPLLGIDLYLTRGEDLPPSPEFGELLGSDTDPTDGWAVSFDTDGYGEFGGILVARAHFAGHDEEIDGDQAVVFIATAAPAGLPTDPQLDFTATALTLTVEDGVATGVLEYHLAVGQDFSPSVATEMAVEVNGILVDATDVETEVVAGGLSCYIGSAPPCDGGCPTGECKTIRVELGDFLFDKCACDLFASVSFSVPAAPGDLVLVRLDAGDDAAEFDEFDNVVGSWIPYVADAPEVPGSRISHVANHPNPFNPRTVLTFVLAAAADVRVEIVDARGRKVRSFGSRRLATGPQELVWNGCDDAGLAAPSGVYWYRVIADDEIATGAMALIR
ncbi:hypothetical protein KDM41_04070 [bacterium]|nr:hypothetical protein [bacterium]